MDLQVVVHDTPESAEKLGDEWQRLHDAAGDRNPFNGPDWPLIWLQHFGGASRPHVLALRAAGGELVGVAPLHLRSALRGRLRMIAPIGIGTPWIMPFELPTLLAAPGAGRDVCRAVVEHLCAEAGSWDVARLMFGSAAAWLEPQWVPEHSHAVLVRRLRADVVLPLDPDVDPYLGRRNLKESFRRARNRLGRDVGADGWSVQRHDEVEDVAAALDRLIVLHRARSDMGDRAPKHADALGVPGAIGYLRDVVSAMAGRDRIRVYELRIGEDVVASLLVLRTATASYFSLTGMTEQAWPYSAVTYLQSIAVADARADGHRLVHLSIGPNQTKLRWTDQVEYHPEFWLVGPTARARTAYLGVEVASVFTLLREARNAHVERPAWWSRRR